MTAEHTTALPAEDLRSALVSIIVPAYNEERYITTILQRVAELPIPKEIIVVDDGSTDGTWKVLEQCEIPGLRLFRHEVNAGKGMAMRTGLAQARGEIILTQDADLEYQPSDIPKLLAPFYLGQSKVVYGSRILTGAAHSYQRYYLGGRFLTWLTNLLYQTNITDEPTGYKLFRREVLEQIPLACSRFEFCPEVTAKVARLGYSIQEVPIQYQPRKISEGKKINWWDGLHAIYILLYYRIVPVRAWELAWQYDRIGAQKSST